MNKRSIYVYIREIKNNALFIVILFLLIISYTIIFPREISLFFQNQSKINTIRTEIASLVSKQSVLMQFDENALNDSLYVFSRLLPIEEDYYSIIQTLNRLSIDTGLGIDKFQISFDKRASNSIKITVDTTGDSEKLFNFFNAYLYKGGRLITLDNIEYVPNFSKKSITLNFYHVPLKTEAIPYNSEEIKKALGWAIKIKPLLVRNDTNINFDANDSNVVPVIGEKENPFNED